MTSDIERFGLWLHMHEAKLHRSARPGVEAVSLTSDRTFPRHSHDQYGVGVVDFGAHRSWSGVGAVEAGPGAVIAVNPDEVHDGAPFGGQVRSWRMLYFNPGVVHRDFDDDMAGAAIEITRPAFLDPDIALLFDRLFTVLTSPSPDQLLIEEAMLRFFMPVLDRHGVARPSARSKTASIAVALQMLDDDPAKAVSLQQLADLSGVSRFQFLRAFFRQTGVTPHAYRLQRRVQMARRLLRAGCRPATVAVDCGFADQSHLTRSFVRQLGVTPARYRAAVR